MTEHLLTYVEAGSASYLLQFLFASLLASLYGVKVFWGQLRNRYRRRLLRR